MTTRRRRTARDVTPKINIKKKTDRYVGRWGSKTRAGEAIELLCSSSIARIGRGQRRRRRLRLENVLKSISSFGFVIFRTVLSLFRPFEAEYARMYRYVV